MSLPTQEFIWEAKQNAREVGEGEGKKGVVTCDELDIHFRREAVLVVAICYINQKKLRLDEPLENRLLLPNDKIY